MKQFRKTCSFVLAVSLILGLCTNSQTTEMKTKKKSAKVSYVKVINVNDGKLKMQKGKSFQLKTMIKVSPNKKKTRRLKYSSSDKKTVFVSSSGKLKAKKNGKVKITVKSEVDSKKKAVIFVTVTKDVLVKSISLNKTKIVTDETNEDGVQLSVKKILPASAKNKEVEWKTSDEDVADVDDDGFVNIEGAGKATITCFAADDGGASAACKITVNESEDADSDDSEENVETETTDSPIPVTSAPTQKPADPTVVPSEIPATLNPTAAPDKTPDAEVPETATPDPIPSVPPVESEKPDEPTETEAPETDWEEDSEIENVNLDISKLTSDFRSDVTITNYDEFVTINLEKNFQNVFWNIPDTVNLAQVTEIIIKANVPEQLAVRVYNNKMDKTGGVWNNKAIVERYPFWGGSYANRKTGDSLPGMTEVETCTCSVTVGESDSWRKAGYGGYIAIGTVNEPKNGFENSVYKIYSIQLVIDHAVQAVDEVVEPSEEQPEG